MGYQYRPLTGGEAKKILGQLRKAQEPGHGIGVDRDSGRFTGAVKSDNVDKINTNSLGGLNTHYSSACRLVGDDERLVKETRTVRERFGNDPQLALVSGKLRWEHDLLVHGSVFPVWVIYPDAYPNDPPTIKVMVDFPEDTPHLIRDQEICWIYPWEKVRERNMWQPGTDTAATAFVAAYQWLLAYLVWRAIGEWPFRDALE